MSFSINYPNQKMCCCSFLSCEIVDLALTVTFQGSKLRLMEADYLVHINLVPAWVFAAVSTQFIIRHRLESFK